ncbi:MAG: sugar ABC transporter permease [Bacilli bacterium]|nr:sugar ABC transporter permease [Bacilli bacterium]MBN2876214.1 sugar ABC transporter permease [Bacilli bacterium]
MYIEIHTTGEKVSAQHNRNFIFFLVPALGAFILIVIVPFLMGLYYSLTDWTGLNNGSEVFVGLDNYSNIFSDYKFVYSFMRTSLYSILNVIVINTVAFSLALLVTQNLKLKNVYRAGFFIPNLIGGLVLGYIWQFIYLNVFPAVADTVPFIGNFLDHSLIGQRASAGEAMGALIGVVTWQYAGYIMMIYIAALQNVPQDLIEASKIDGANSFQRLRTIIFPLVAQAFTISLFLTLVTSFKQYDTVYALTQGGPTNLIPTWLANFMDEPFYKTVETLDLMANNIYQTAFGYGEMGIGQAKAIIFFIILMLVSIAQVTYSQKREVEL